MDYEITQIELTHTPTAVIRGTVPEAEISGFLGSAFGEVMAALMAQGLTPTGMPFGCYSPPADGVFELEAGFSTSVPVTPVGRVVASAHPGGSAIQILHRGAYEGVGAAYQAAEQWMAAQGWESTGSPWEEYLDEPSVPQPRTLVTWPSGPRSGQG